MRARASAKVSERVRVRARVQVEVEVEVVDEPTLSIGRAGLALVIFQICIGCYA